MMSALVHLSGSYHQAISLQRTRQAKRPPGAYVCKVCEERRVSNQKQTDEGKEAKNGKATAWWEKEGAVLWAAADLGQTQGLRESC